jgi:streptogramin lyase
MTNTIDVAWIGVLLATIAGFTLNMIWFSPKVFYTRWQRALGRSEPPTGDASGMGPAFGSVLLALIVQAVSVDWLLQAAAALYGHELSAVSGFLIGAGAGVGFAAAASLGHRVFSGQGFKVWLIEVGADVLGLALMGAILSVWR